MPSVDERIVQIRMENNQFEREANNTMGTLSKLSSAFGNFGSSMNKDIDMSGIQKSINSVSFNPIQSGIDVTVNGFNNLETIATDALLRIARKAEDVAVTLVKALSVDQIMSGFSEYELKLDTIQVILANTQGTATLEIVKDRLEELNNYADKTIYNFGQMTQNIGRFTAAGVGLDESVTAIKGLSNLSALVGASSADNSRVMYNLSQALSSGKLMLRDWMSFENSGGLGGKVFRDELIKTANELGYFAQQWSTKSGTVIEGADLMAEASKSFRDTLVYGWVDNTVLIETLAKFADESTDLGKQAYEAATSVRTFTKLMDALKESVQSGWAETWEIIVGDYEAAPKMWNKVNEIIGGFLEKQTEARNADLEAWANNGGREKLIKGISNTYETITIIIDRLGSIFDKIFTISRLDILNNFSSGFELVTGTILKWVESIDNAFGSLESFTENLKFPEVDLFGGLLKDENGERKKLFEYVSIMDLASDAVGTFASRLGALIKFISDNFSILGIIERVIGIMFVVSKLDLVKKIGEAFETFGGLTSPLKSVAEVIDNFGESIKVEKFRNIAVSLAIVTAAAVALAMIPTENLIKAGVALTAIGGIILGFTTAISKLMSNDTISSGQSPLGKFFQNLIPNDTTKKFRNIGLAFAAFSIGALLLANSIKTLGSLSWSQILTGLGSLAAVMALVAGAAKLFDKFNVKIKSIYSMAGAMILLSTAISMLVIPLFALSLIPFGNIIKGLSSIALAIALFAGAAKVLEAIKFNVKSFLVLFGLSTNIFAFSVALTALLVPLTALSLMPFKNIIKGFTSLAIVIGLFISTVIALDAISYNLESFIQLAGFAVNITALGIAFTALVIPLTVLSLIPFESIVGGIMAMVIAIGMIIGLSKLLEFAKVGIETFLRLIALSGGIIVLSVALTTLLVPLLALSMLPFSKFIKGLVGIAAALALILGAAKLIEKLKLDNVSIKVFGKLSLSIIMVSLAATAFAGAVVAVTAAIKYLVQTVMAGIGAVVKFFAALFGVDVGAAELGESIVNELDVSDELKQTGKENINSFNDGLKDNTSSVTNTVNDVANSVTNPFGNISLSGIANSIFGPFLNEMGSATEGISSFGTDAIENITGSFSGLDLTGIGNSAMSPLNDELGNWGSILGLTSEGNVDSIVSSLGESVQNSIPTIQEQGTSIFDAFINGVSGEESVKSTTRTEHPWDELEQDPLSGIEIGTDFMRSINPDHYSYGGKAIYAGIRKGFMDEAGNWNNSIRVWLDEAGNLLDYHPELDAEITSFDLSTPEAAANKSLFDSMGEILQTKVTKSVEEVGGIPGILGSLLGTVGESGWDGIGEKIKDLFTGTVEEAGGIKGIFGALIGTEEGEDPWDAVSGELEDKAKDIGKSFGDSLKSSFSESIGSFFANVYTSMRQWLNNDDTYNVVFNNETGMFEEVLNTDKVIEYEELLEMFANNSKASFQAAALYAKQHNIEETEFARTLAEDVEAYKKGVDNINEALEYGPLLGVHDLFSWIGNLFTPEAHAAELTPEERAQIYTEPVQQVVDSVNENTKDIILKAETNSTQNSEDLGKALQLPPAPVDPNTVSQEFIGPIQQTKDAVMTGVDGVIEEAQAEKEAKVGQLADALTIKVVDVFAESGSDVAESASGVTDSIADTMTTEADTAMPEAANGILSKLSTNIKNYISSHMPSASIDVITSLVDKMKDKMTEDAPGTSEHIVGTLADNIKTKAGEQAPPAGMEISGQVISGAIKYADENSGNAGTSIVNGIVNSALSQDNITALINAGKSIGTTLLNATNSVLAIASPSKEFGKVADYSVLGLVKRVEDNLSVVSDAGSEIGGSFLTAYQDMMDRINTAINSDVTPTVSPILDLTGLQNDVSRINGMFSRDNLAMANDINYSFNERQSAFLDSRNYPTPINYREDLYSLHNDLASLSSLMSNLQVVLDTGSLVGGMRQQLNTSLGATAARRIRGL